MYRFWGTGFHSTSLDDLLEASGMHRGSFYRTFGDKRAAFDAAFALYVQRVAETDVFPALTSTGSPMTRLEDLLIARLDAALGDAGHAAGDRPGCLITNTATELAAHDEQASEQVGAALGGARDSIAALLRAAVEANEADPALDTEAAADHLFTLLQGAIVMSRSGQSADRLHELLRRAIDVVVPPPAEGEPR
jgi:TetR/AcrR family transcriptional regulator, transcriptional repressor for nem operon